MPSCPWSADRSRSPCRTTRSPNRGRRRRDSVRFRHSGCRSTLSGSSARSSPPILVPGSLSGHGESSDCLCTLPLCAFPAACDRYNISPTVLEPTDTAPAVAAHECGSAGLDCKMPVVSRILLQPPQAQHREKAVHGLKKGPGNSPLLVALPQPRQDTPRVGRPDHRRGGGHQNRGLQQVGDHHSGGGKAEVRRLNPHSPYFFAVGHQCPTPSQVTKMTQTPGAIK